MSFLRGEAEERAPRWRDLAAIRRLEAEIIPWHNPGADEPSTRQIREASAGNPLASAEGYLGYRLRAGAQGAPGGRPAANLADQGRHLLDWAAREGRLIDRAFLGRLWNVGGVEHDVFHCAQTGRWVKFTLPGRGGQMIDVEPAGAGLPGRLVTGDAPPFVYLRRLTMANSRLGDDLWLHGVVDDPAGPRMVVSQRDIGGEPASYEAIALHFGAHGFLAIKDRKTFYHPAENLLVSDAHPGNVFCAPQGAIAFDVCVQRPEGALREAVTPRGALDFGEEAEQRGLAF